MFVDGVGPESNESRIKMSAVFCTGALMCSPSRTERSIDASHSNLWHWTRRPAEWHQLNGSTCRLCSHKHSSVFEERGGTLRSGAHSLDCSSYKRRERQCACAHSELCFRMQMDIVKMNATRCKHCMYCRWWCQRETGECSRETGADAAFV